MMSWFTTSLASRQSIPYKLFLFSDSKKAAVSGYLPRTSKDSTISLRMTLQLGLKSFQISLKDNVVKQKRISAILNI